MSIRPALTIAAAVWLIAVADTRGVFAATVTVAAGGNLQATLDAAQPGDVILLAAGVTFTGNFVLPVKGGAQFITVRSSTPDSQLPPTGVRMTPAYASLLAKIQSPNSAPAIKTAPGAHHWRLMFLEFPSTKLGYYDIIALGDGSGAQSLLSQVPHDIELDRVYVHGHPLYGQKRGVALNGRTLAVRNSYVSEIKAAGVDAQAIAGWNGPGPLTIENNYLEASGENFLLGGADPGIVGLTPTDVTFRHNHVARPLAWRDPIIPVPAQPSTAVASGGALPAGTHEYRIVARRPIGAGLTGQSKASPPATVAVADQSTVTVTWQPVADATSYRIYVRRPDGGDWFWTVSGTTFVDTGAAGTAGAPPLNGDVWQVKNLFELKNARNVVIEYNIFENNWLAAQNGYAILFTPRNQDGKCTWCVVEDVTFQYNILRYTGGGINLAGYDWPNQSAQTNNIRIRHNLVYGVSRQQYGGAGWFVLIGDEPRDIVIDHNTVDHDGSAIVYAHGGTLTAPKQITGFQFTNNAARHNSYGINGANLAFGNTVIAAYFPGAVVQGNWLAGGSASRYPAGNYFGSPYESAFVDSAGGDYGAAPAGPLCARATDGRDIGADIQTLLARVRGVVSGAPTAVPRAPSGLRILTR
jgi:hypothetical protein